MTAGHATMGDAPKSEDWVLCGESSDPVTMTYCAGGDAAESHRPCLNASLVPEYSQYSSGSKGQVFAVLSLLAPPEDGEASRAPVHLTAVLDQSGSMGGSKLELVKATTDFMATQLSKSDMLSIVSYDSEVHDVMGMSNMTPENKITAKSKIARIHSGSTTNLSGGLFRGVEQQMGIAKVAQSESSVVRSIFLLTDGLPNVGVQDPDTMAQVVQGMQGGLGPNEKIGVHTFGFGRDHNPELLGKIAEGCGGTYHYIESQEQVPVVFGEALGGLLSMSCQNVEVTITSVAGSRLKRLKTNFKQEELPDGSIRVKVGDLFADERKDLVLEVELQPNVGDTATAAAQDDNNGSGADDVEVLQVHVKYLHVIACQLREASTTLTVQRPSEVDEDSQTISELVQFHKARIEASQALEDAQAKADRGNLEAARLQLGDMVIYLGKVQNSLKSSTDVADLASLQAEVRGTIEKFSDRETYTSLGKKQAFALSKCHFDQRSNGASRRAYSTPMQENMSMEASVSVMESAPAAVQQQQQQPVRQQRQRQQQQQQQQPVRQAGGQSRASNGLAKSLQRLLSGRSRKEKRPSSSGLAQAQMAQLATQQPDGDVFDVGAMLQCNNVGDILNNVGNVDDDAVIQQQQQQQQQQ